MIDYGIADCEPWDYDGPSCYDCEEKEKELERVKEDLSDLVKVLYKGGELDIEGIDVCVEQLCFRLGVDYPKECLSDIYEMRGMISYEREAVG